VSTQAQNEIAEQTQGIVAYEQTHGPATVKSTAVAPSWHQGWEYLRVTVNETTPQSLTRMSRHIDSAWRALARG
jgi:hypothetical protein